MSSTVCYTQKNHEEIVKLLSISLVAAWYHAAAAILKNILKHQTVQKMITFLKTT
jgi:hypothetical protein